MTYHHYELISKNDYPKSRFESKFLLESILERTESKVLSLIPVFFLASMLHFARRSCIRTESNIELKQFGWKFWSLIENRSWVFCWLVSQGTTYNSSFSYTGVLLGFLLTRILVSMIQNKIKRVVKSHLCFYVSYSLYTTQQRPPFMY